MKELSIEEKARRYDEAIERARTEYKNHEAFKGFCEMLVNIFPEFAESEDERIRKQIISFLKEFEYDHYRCLDFSSWIAWLEKQSKQKSADKAEPKFKVGDWITATYYIPDGYHAEINGNVVIIKKGEQKPLG